MIFNVWSSVSNRDYMNKPCAYVKKVNSGFSFTINFVSCRLYKWIFLIKHRKDVLVITNVQNDYIDGPMGLHQFGVGRNGLEVVEPINYLLRNDSWYMVVYTQNWHPADHVSFIENLALHPIHPSTMVPK